MDIEFLALVQSVMARIHEHANSDASNNVQRHLIRVSALKAMKSAVTLETFNGGGVQERLRLIWSCIINNSQETGMHKVPMSAAKGFL